MTCRAFAMWYPRLMPVVVIVVVAVLAFVAVNGAMLVLLHSTRGQREALVTRREASTRPLRIKTH
jgi:hypothetical protein